MFFSSRLFCLLPSFSPCCHLTPFSLFLLMLTLIHPAVAQSQSQGSITLKIIPAIKEEDRLRESRVRLTERAQYNGHAPLPVTNPGMVLVAGVRQGPV